MKKFSFLVFILLLNFCSSDSEETTNENIESQLLEEIPSPESEIITNDGGGYGEVHYVIDPTIGKFGSFAFKIVLRSSNTSNVPTVKDFRAVAAT